MSNGKRFQRKAYGLNGFDTFFPHFSPSLLFFACICFCFDSHKIYSDVLLMTNSNVFLSRYYLAYLLASLKAIKFNGVDTTGFLQNLLGVKYLFILFDF